MTGRILVCDCCKQPLQIVCPTHGTDTVARSWPDPLHGIAPSTLRPGTVRERIVAVLPAETDRTGATVPEIAERLETVTVQHVRAEVAELMRRGLIERVARGRYVRGSRA
jgi:hypothetical protein